MASLDQHQSRSRTKLLIVGNSGTGKTSLLAGLANAGYELFILDYDDGLDPLTQLVKADKLSNVHFETLTDDVKFNGAGVPIVTGTPKAFMRTIKLLNNWTDSETGEDFGPISSFGPDKVIVVDSLTRMGDAAMRWTLYQNKRIGKKKRINDWGDAIERQEALIQRLCGDGISCNVVVSAHLKRLRIQKNEFEDKEEIEETLTKKQYPSALGQNFPNNISTYFNTVVQTKLTGSGKNARRVLVTTPDPEVDLKVPSPKVVLPAQLDLDTALPTLFKTLQNGKD